MNPSALSDAFELDVNIANFVNYGKTRLDVQKSRHAWMLLLLVMDTDD